MFGKICVSFFFFADRGPATQNKMNLTKTQKCLISLRKSALVVLPTVRPKNLKELNKTSTNNSQNQNNKSQF